MEKYNLNKLLNLIGKDNIKVCFTEYMLDIIAKAEKYDNIYNLIKFGKDVNIDRIKEIVFSEEEE